MKNGKIRYLFRKSFKRKIIIPTVVVLVALVVILNVFLTVRFSAFGDYLINEKLIANINTLHHFLNESSANSRAAAVSSALNPDVVKAVKKRDRNKLLELFAAICDLYRISYFTICDNEGNVLVRTYDPENFGDSIINQHNVKDASNGNVSTYVESGTLIKVSIRTGAPVYDMDGTLIGIISAGVRLDTGDAVNGLKELLGSEVTVFFNGLEISTTMMKDGQGFTGTIIDPDIAEIVIENRREYSDDIDILGEKYKTFYQPLLNAENKVFAVIVLSIPKMELVTVSNSSIRDGVILGLCGLAVSIALLFIIISSISTPIIKLLDDMNDIANGNLSIDINAKNEDEVGRLAKSLQTIVSVLYKLLENINMMIAEHAKGNTDYCIDTKDFHGDYKTLANSVVELATYSMRDQLTEIPNRRSFDNRLDLEWNRSKREKTPISILMIDVDKFKNYNDAYGHQQGDIALQTVAKVLKQSIRRTIDFIARWGGEEFTVLLPDTYSSGAISIAEKIRAEIEHSVIPCADPKGVKITVSIGVNTQIPSFDSSIDDFIATVDRALYRAKETGRNKVIPLDNIKL